MRSIPSFNLAALASPSSSLSLCALRQGNATTKPLFRWQSPAGHPARRRRAGSETALPRGVESRTLSPMPGTWEYGQCLHTRPSPDQRLLEPCEVKIMAAQAPKA